MALNLKKGMWVIITNPQSEYYFEEGAYTGEWQCPMWCPMMYQIRLTIDGKHKDVYFPNEDLKAIERTKNSNIERVMETLNEMFVRKVIDQALDDNNRELFYQLSNEFKKGV